jgi:hypothetical protein
VQLDGSFHEWLEEREPRGCLMHMVDDATRQGLGCFSEEETIWAAAGVLRRWIERHGVPQALYTDWKNVYVRPPNAEERASGEAAVTQFGRMCAKLGIRIIAASSPQAKGRVERAHGTHQDRLGSGTTTRPMRFSINVIWPNTTGATRTWLPPHPIITGDGLQRGNWTKCSGWKKNPW